MNKIRKGDQVIVLTGRDKGKRGTVLRRVDDDRIVVEGVNVVKKHVKPNPMKGTTGGVVDKTLSINQSNVATFNPATGKADRVGIKLLSDAERANPASYPASVVRPLAPALVADPLAPKASQLPVVSLDGSEALVCD